MRLVTYRAWGETRLGVEYESSFIDLNRAAALHLQAQGEPRPAAMADVLVPPETIAFLEGGERALTVAADALADVVQRIERAHEGEQLAKAHVIVADDAAERLAPVPRPRQIVCIGRNYEEHAHELGEKVPEVPVLFAKLPSAVTGPDMPIVLEGQSDSVDYEGELAVVIGRRARHLDRKEALNCVAGYTICNDVSARDFQYRTGQFLMGKSFDTFCPMGPVLLTADEVRDPQKLDIETRVNGEVRQRSNTRHCLFSVAELIAFMAELWTLEPGDLILTGTPAGVGKGMDPPRYLQPGDAVEISIERIGTLRNPVIAV